MITPRLSKRKWSLRDKSCAEAFSWPVVRLGSDDHGTWLGARRGNPVRRPDGRVEAQREDGVWLIADEAWWLPAFRFTEETDLTIDICTPPLLDAGTSSFVDLELDVYRRADGTAGVVDEDELELLTASGLVSTRDIQRAPGSTLFATPKPG